MMVLDDRRLRPILADPHFLNRSWIMTNNSLVIAGRIKVALWNVATGNQTATDRKSLGEKMLWLIAAN